MKAVHPYLLFNGNTAEVFEFYGEVTDRFGTSWIIIIERPMT